MFVVCLKGGQGKQNIKMIGIRREVMENKINMSNLQVLDLVEIRMKVDENLSFFAILDERKQLP